MIPKTLPTKLYFLKVKGGVPYGVKSGGKFTIREHAVARAKWLAKAHGCTSVLYEADVVWRETQL